MTLLSIPGANFAGSDTSKVYSQEANFVTTKLSYPPPRTFIHFCDLVQMETSGDIEVQLKYDVLQFQLFANCAFELKDSIRT